MKELECAFGVVGNILMNMIKWNLFGKIWIQNVKDIDFEVIFVAEIQIGSKKPCFGRKNQLKTW